MKGLIIAVFICFPCLAFSQANTDSAARTVINEVMQSTLGIQNGNAVDIRAYNRFKEHFDIKAKIINNFNVVFGFNTDSGRGGYRVTDPHKYFDAFAHELALKIYHLTIKKNVAIAGPVISENDRLTYECTREVTFKKYRKYVMADAGQYIDSLINSRKDSIDFGKDARWTENTGVVKQFILEKLEATKDLLYEFSMTETLRITVEKNSLKILSIENKEGFPVIITLNDGDKDGITDDEDEDDYRPGEFTAKGRRDRDLDGQPDLINKKRVDYCPLTFGTADNHGCPDHYFLAKNVMDGFVGVQLNDAAIQLPELNNLGYADANGNSLTDVLQSEKGALKNPKLKPGTYAGANFTRYFGKSKQTGISAGVTYSGFRADYQLTAPMVYTFKSFDGNFDYRRQVVIKNLDEEITYRVLNIPVMFNFRMRNVRKTRYEVSLKTTDTNGEVWGSGKSTFDINLKAGPSLMLFNNTSAYNAVISFGGLYQTDGNGVVYNDFFDDSDSYNLFLTEEGINGQNPVPGAEDVFRRLRENASGYDFASNKNYRGVQQDLTRAAIAINAGFDAHYQVIEKLGLKASAHFVYAPAVASKEKYKPIDKTPDTFQSIYYSNAPGSYLAFGISLGFVYHFIRF